MKKTIFQIKIILTGYVIALLLSGITAFFVPEGIHALVEKVPQSWVKIQAWLQLVQAAIEQSPRFLLYGYDWLAFAHIAISVSFYGVWRDPVRNKWVIEWAMLTSLLIFPLAFILGAVRGIPFWWQIIDCSFGAGSLIPLIMIHRRIRVLEREEYEDSRVLKFF